MEGLLQYFDKAQGALAVIGGIAVGLPALLRAVHMFLLMIPGDQGEKFLEKFLVGSEKIAELIGKVFPKPKA